ncbi:hypothetical protein GCM10009749_30150 [Agromyces neolithicus]|uniref:Uncharacterized protein n=1 Tax=Agromyces neolithicus TaxID=269420 RepID=A0ABN2MB40_9MICO
MVEQAALRDTGGFGRGVEGSGPLALGDDDALECVEHRLAGGWGAAHDPIVVDVAVLILLLYQPDGTVIDPR